MPCLLALSWACLGLWSSFTAFTSDLFHDFLVLICCGHECILRVVYKFFVYSISECVGFRAFNVFRKEVREHCSGF